jgi:AraC family transcriptional regulator
VLTQLSPGTFYGDGVKERAIAGVHLSERTYSPDYRTPAHAHENAFFYLVVDGECHEVCGKETRVSPPATLVYQPAGQPHADRWPGEGGRCFHVEFDRRWLDALRDEGAEIDRPACHRTGLPVWLATRLYGEFHKSDAASSLAVHGIALELLAAQSRLPESPCYEAAPRWLRQAGDLVHDRYTENIGLEEIAAAVGVHPAHLARTFRRYHRMSIGDYVRKLRIEHSCRRLSTTDESLADIALSAGFSDQSHFNRVLKLHTGFTPTEFRRRFSLRSSYSKE